jgi:hypothetical protein
LFLDFIASQPTALAKGPDYPTLTPERALKDRNLCIEGMNFNGRRNALPNKVLGAIPVKYMRILCLIL